MTNETAPAAETAGQVEILPPERTPDFEAIRNVLAGELALAHETIKHLASIIRSPHSSFEAANLSALAAGQLMRGSAAIGLALSKLSGEMVESRQRISVEYLNRDQPKGGEGGGAEI